MTTEFEKLLSRKADVVIPLDREGGLSATEVLATRSWHSRRESEMATYHASVEEAIGTVVKLAEGAEAGNHHELSSWFGDVCKWIRDREQEEKGFVLTLPDKDFDLIILEVRDPVN